MRKTLCFCALSTVFSVLAFADSFSGKLIDASCYAKQQSSMGCEPSSATSSFALDVSGKVYNLDSSGNKKAAAALKNRADRTADPTKTHAKEVMATVEGSENAGSIKVTSIEVQ
jgi:hypothetical protein